MKTIWKITNHTEKIIILVLLVDNPKYKYVIYNIGPGSYGGERRTDTSRKNAINAAWKAYEYQLRYAEYRNELSNGDN